MAEKSKPIVVPSRGSALRQDRGMFLHIDGIDGAGKSTLLEAARAWAISRGLSLFDSVAWSQRGGRIPSLEDAAAAEVLLTAEPSHAWIGRAIRDEIIRRDTPYEARFAAQAFALDRGLQYERLILPFLRARPRRWVFQDRGLLSSLAYQPLQDEMDERRREAALNLDWLLTLPGNRLALANPPDVFVFLDIDPKLARQRLAGRTSKIDNHIYDTFEFQTRLAERFRLPEVTQPLTARGTRIVNFEGGRTREQVRDAMFRLLNELAG